MTTCNSNLLHCQSITAIKGWNHAYLFLVGIVCLFCTSSYALEELATIDPLPPMERDKRSIGWEWHYVDQTGKRGHMRLTAADEHTDTYYRTDGCTWTRPLAGFAPASQWRGCPSSGTSTVTLDSPSIWPLEVGNRFEWTMTGRSSLIKRKWKLVVVSKGRHRYRLSASNKSWPHFTRND